MPKKDKRVDAYIAKAADFAKPVLIHLRKLVHQGCPDVEETMKWGFPFFVYHGPMCNMAGFKNHCAFGFWKASLMKDAQKFFPGGNKMAMGDLGTIKSLNDLPSDKLLLRFIKEAAKLNKDGVKLVRKTPAVKKELEIPSYFTKALSKNKKAQKTFDAFSYTNKKEYVEWITEAKTDETRDKRLDTAIEWMAEGKIRNWKYLKK